MDRRGSANLSSSSGNKTRCTCERMPQRALINSKRVETMNSFILKHKFLGHMAREISENFAKSRVNQPLLPPLSFNYIFSIQVQLILEN